MRPIRRSGGVILSALFLLGLWPGSPRAQLPSPDRTILRYQRILQRNPRDARTYYRLGDAYIQKARESGDVTYFTLAEQALRKALDISPGYSDALRHLAFVLYSRHDFAGAATEARKATELNPADPHAYGILGDAYLEVGRYSEAEAAYGQMMGLDANLYSLSRLSGLKSLRGDPEGAIADLHRALETGKTERRPRESIAWGQWQLGSEHFALGNLRLAEARYLGALSTYPNYYRGLAGLAQVRAAQKRYPEAIDLYQRAIAIIPQPDYAATLGDIYAKIGRPEEAKKQYDLVEYIGYLNTLNRVLYNRELGAFYADHDIKLAEALDLARKELEYRRDIYAYDLLAWTLHKNGKSQEALPAMTEALKLGTKDARLFFHAGMIYHGIGETDKATTYLRRALATNPSFHIFHAEVAERTLQELEGQLTLREIQEKGRGQ